MIWAENWGFGIVKLVFQSVVVVENILSRLQVEQVEQVAKGTMMLWSYVGWNDLAEI